jgi:hypothetical protein
MREEGELLQLAYFYLAYQRRKLLREEELLF